MQWGITYSAVQNEISIGNFYINYSLCYFLSLYYFVAIYLFSKRNVFVLLRPRSYEQNIASTRYGNITGSQEL